MNTAPTLAPPTTEQQTSLSVKITVIVFWGMFMVGLLAAMLLLRGMEQTIREQQQTGAQHIAYETELFLNRQPAAPLADIGDALAAVLAESEIHGVLLERDHKRHIVGDIRRGPHSTYQFDVHAQDPNRAGLAALPVHITVYQPRIADSVAQKRKVTLVTLGGVLLLFGIGLRALLNRVLHEPIQRMIAAVKAFSDGNTEQRLDEQRRDEFGYLARFVNQALDHTARQQQALRDASESALFAERERAQVTLHSIGDAVITTDAHGRIDYLNPAASRLADLDAGAVRGRDVGQLLSLVDEHSRRAIENPVLRCLRDGQGTETPQHVILLRRDGSELDISFTVAPIHDRTGAIVGAVLVFHDVGQARNLTRQLSYQASHDALTGIFNRQEFEHRLREAIETVRTDEHGHAICFIDMDQFKIVNDTCGHAAGDELLRRFATLLKGHVRDSDIVARLGGDEFGVLLQHCNAQQAQQVMQNFIEKVREWTFTWSSHSFRVGASAGLVTLPPGNHNIADVMSAADVACYAAKDGGRNRVHVFHPDDRDLHHRRANMNWISRLTQGFTDGRFRLFTQPVSRISRHDAAVEYREVLLRFRDEAGQLIPPGAFLPAAERYNLVPRIDRWVLATTLEQLQSPLLRNRGDRFGINLSGLSVSDDEFLRYAIEQLDQSGVAPQRICFEVTETAVIASLEQADRFIRTMKERGCLFALDDFGSGLSSFNYLKRLRVDYLKIDGAFVKNMANDALDRATVAAIHDIGATAGVRVIAESAEDRATLDTLRGLGIELAQGYGIAPPTPIEDLFYTTRAERAS